MCLDNIEEIAAAVEAAKKAKAEAADIREYEARDGTITVNQNIVLTLDEIRLIHARRIKAAEAKLRDLGFRGPVVKPAPADSGDAQRTLASNRTGENR